MMEELWQSFLQDWSAQGPLDITITLTALIYVILSARNSVWCWPFGIVSCALWAYVSYVHYDLYIDALLQVFYVVMGGWGIYRWLYGGSKAGELHISQLPLTQHLRLIAAGLLASTLFGYFFATYTAAAASYLDALTTVFSIIATVLLVQRRLENWLYWIVIDLLYCGLYWSRGAVLFALLMLIYTVIAYGGWKKWRNFYLELI